MDINHQKHQQQKCIKVIFDGKMLGPLYSDKISIETVFDTLGIEKLRYSLYDLEGNIVSSKTQDSPFLNYGIYELLPNTVNQSLLTSSPTYNASITEALQEHEQEQDSSTSSTSNVSEEEWTGVLDMIKTNLSKLTKECRELARKYKYDTQKYRHQVLSSLQELRKMEQILINHSDDKFTTWHQKLSALKYVCQCLIVEYMDILDHDCPPFYPSSPLKSHSFESHKSSQLSSIRANLKSPIGAPQLVQFEDHQLSRKLRRTKINYIKSLIETDSYKDQQLKDVMEVVGNLETLRQNGLLGRSRCHGKYDIYPVQDIKSHLASDFRLNQKHK